MTDIRFSSTSAARPHSALRGALLALAAGALLAACGGGGADTTATASPASTGAPTQKARSVDGSPDPGNAGGSCAAPAEAQPVETTAPDHVVGDGSAASCTSEAVVAAVAQGGVTTFSCGPDPVTITMTATAKVFNDKPNVVLDGGGLVTLSGGGALRILYQNSCDPAQVWTSERCDLQDTPQTTVQNLTLVDGNSAGQNYGQGEVSGGGAIFMRGGRMKIVGSRFFRNQCEATGPDLGGGAVRAFGDFGASSASTVVVAGSTFGGAEGYGNQCSNGGALSGLGASFTVLNTLVSHNRATDTGGGGGGGIYQDGNRIDLSLCGSSLHDNATNQGGGALFFVSNDRSGTMSITDSLLQANPSGAFETDGLPGIFVLAAPGQPVVSNSTISK
jgi:hypothetical protein